MSAAVLDLLPVVERVCRGRLGGFRWLDPADAVQDALVSLLAHADPSAALAVTIAARRCVDMLRASPPMTALHQVGERSSASAGPDEVATVAVIRRRLDVVLTDAERRVLFLRMDVDLSAEQAAAVLGCRAGAVRAAQHRAVRKLRAALVGGVR